MADDEIVEKLRRYTHSYPKDEASVMYVMVQAGKIIERNGWAEEFPVLRFYRNWVAHPRLDQRGRDGRTEMLDRLNDAIAAVIEKKDTHILERFEGAISLKNLHKELAVFFQRHGLERPGFDYASWLRKFDALLVSILVDLPLIPLSGAGYLFTEFRFKRSNAGEPDAEFEIQVPKEVNGGKPLTIGGKLRTESDRQKSPDAELH